MAEVAGSTVTNQGTTQGTNQITNQNNSISFTGTPHNMALGFAILLAGGLAFTMGMTDVYFAEATAWTVVAWGALFIYNNLIEVYQTYKVTEEALVVDTPMRPVERHKVFDWAYLHRVDLIVKRNEPKSEDIIMHVYHTPEGETTLDREDRKFDAALAQLIMDRAGLKPTSKDLPTDMSKLKLGKGHYVWNKSGKAPTV